MSQAQILFFGYPPCVAELFRPFAKLPYTWAYCVWLAFSLAVYAGGLLILFRKRLPSGIGRTAFLLSLSAPMYTVETWLAGELSVLIFFAVVLFVHYFESRRLLLAGLALGLASYKPSLMAIPAAVMVLNASWRMLAGLCTSSALIVLTSVGIAGVSGLEQWIRALQLFSSLATAGNTVLRRTKYVDLNSFFAILLGENPVSRILSAVSISAAFLFLARACWRARKQPPEVQRYLWVGALTWTLIINIYVGIYDTIVLVPATALVAYSQAHQSNQERATLHVWVIILWLAPWLTQPCADYLRVQILTIVLAVFGYWALSLARRGSPSTAESTPGEALPL